MKIRSLLSPCLSAMLLFALADYAPAWAGSRGTDYRRAGDSYRAEARRGIQRDHHRGRGFTERRSRRENPSYIRRDDRRRALSADDAERSGRQSSVPLAAESVTCRTMASVDKVDGRLALVSQRECIDASGITRVSPGSRKVVRFYDE